MRRRVGSLVTCFTLLVLGLAAAPNALAHDPVPPQPRTRHLLALGLGPVYWPDLHDADPTGSSFVSDLGRFHTWGFSLEFAYQYRAAQWGSVDALFNIDMGILNNESSDRTDLVLPPYGGTFPDDLVANVLFLTPGARFVFANTERWRFHAGFGAGLYLAEFVEERSYYGYDYEGRELWDETTLGGYLSLGGDYRVWTQRPRWRMRFEYKAHFADFGDTAPIAPGGGDLKGPIQTLFVGFVWQI